MPDEYSCIKVIHKSCLPRGAAKARGIKASACHESRGAASSRARGSISRGDGLPRVGVGEIERGALELRARLAVGEEGLVLPNREKGIDHHRTSSASIWSPARVQREIASFPA